jgi:hypothetical protein
MYKSDCLETYTRSKIVSNKGMELTGNISGVQRKGLGFSEVLWAAAHPDFRALWS